MSNTEDHIVREEGNTEQASETPGTVGWYRNPWLEPESGFIDIPLPEKFQGLKTELYRTQLSRGGEHYLILKQELSNGHLIGILFLFKCAGCNKMLSDVGNTMAHIFTICESYWRENMCTPEGIHIVPLYFKIITLDDRICLGKGIKHPSLFKNIKPLENGPPGAYVAIVKGLWQGMHLHGVQKTKDPVECQKQGGYPYNQVLALFRQVYLNVALKDLPQEDPFSSFFNGIKQTLVEDIRFKTMIEGEWYTIERSGSTAAVVYFICTECPTVFGRSITADTHALEKHGTAIGENVNVFQEYLRAQEDVPLVGNRSTNRESQIALKIQGTQIPQGNDYDWSKIEIASPITFKFVQGTHFHEKLEEDLIRKNLTLIVNQQSNPFRLCKIVIQKMHQQLLKKYTLSNNFGYKKIEGATKYLLEISEPKFE